MRTLFILLVAVVLASGCDQTDPCADGVGEDCVPGEDFIVNGVNLTRLTATPTNGEISLVRADWESRDIDLASVPRVRYGESTRWDNADGSRNAVFPGITTAGDTIVFVGVYAPTRALGDVTLVPSLLYLPTGGEDVIMDPSPSPIPLSGMANRTVVMTMVFPGQALHANRRAFRPNAPADPFGLELDAVISWYAATQHVGFDYNTDPSRFALIGVGEGGTLASLAAQSSRLPASFVVAVQPLTSFFLEDTRTNFARALRGESIPAFRGLQQLVDQALFPIRDGQLSISAARIGMLKRSPAYFTPPTGFTIVATGTQVFGIPAAHGRAMTQRLGNERSVLLETDAPVVSDILRNPSLDNQVTMRLRNANRP